MKLVFPAKVGKFPIPERTDRNPIPAERVLESGLGLPAVSLRKRDTGKEKGDFSL